MVDNSLTESACQEALAVHARMILGEETSASARELLAAHVSQCLSCRARSAEISATDAQLRETFGAPQLSSSFTARTMAAIATARFQTAPENAGALSRPGSARVYSVAPQSSWKRPALAAAAVVGVLVAWVAFTALLPLRGGVLSVRRGQVLAPNGEVVTRLEPGTVYRATEDSIVPLRQTAAVKVQEGAQFQVSGGRGSDANLTLRSGDLFAWNQPGHTSETLRVACADFETVLNNGDAYVATDGNDEHGGVVIVFNGHAQVVRNNEVLPVRAGQVFVVLGGEDAAFAQMLELQDALAKVRDEPRLSEDEEGEMRRLYEQRIAGYRTELTDLEKQLARENNPDRMHELQKRQALVVMYRDAHQRKLKDLGRQFPNEQIERGVREHSDPATWM